MNQSQQLGYLNSKLMLSWDCPFKWHRLPFQTDGSCLEYLVVITFAHVYNSTVWYGTRPRRAKRAGHRMQWRVHPHPHPGGEFAPPPPPEADSAPHRDGFYPPLRPIPGTEWRRTYTSRSCCARDRLTCLRSQLTANTAPWRQGPLPRTSWPFGRGLGLV